MFFKITQKLLKFHPLKFSEGVKTKIHRYFWVSREILTHFDNLHGCIVILWKFYSSPFLGKIAEGRNFKIRLGSIVPVVFQKFWPNRFRMNSCTHKGYFFCPDSFFTATELFYFQKITFLGPQGAIVTMPKETKHIFGLGGVSAIRL